MLEETHNTAGVRRVRVSPVGGKVKQLWRREFVGKGDFGVCGRKCLAN